MGCIKDMNYFLLCLAGYDNKYKLKGMCPVFGLDGYTNHKNDVDFMIKDFKGITDDTVY